MSKITIVTDGVCDLSNEMIEKYDIVTVPYRILFGEEIYRIWYNDKTTLSLADYCEKLKTVTKENFPHTSIPSPGEFQKTFEEAFKKSDTVIAVLLTSGMSGTVQAALGVAKDFFEGKDLTVFDSLHTMTGVGNQALEAAKMAHAGKSKEEILARLEAIRDKTRYVLATADLNFLEKQGRLGPIEKIRDQNPDVIPTIHEKDGILQPLTMFQNEADLTKRMSAFAEKIAGLAETDDIFLTHINMHAAAEKVFEILNKNKKEGTKIHYYEAGTILGVYAGPRCFSLSYIGDFEKEWL